ncbi:TaqI-like C-terminal specificity domain-containing protein [Bacteroides ovatus]|jgi:type II restriction/modification system DNA methylase subunit YeeA|uniref:TaqI-like C-terminal specificity domain-containing protein n=1 Tax=Bacteroides ovatus TaxID=28116 RepID=UPI000E51D999|nr:TaqI-like C-terminal specificity domain-containing protein [Bacteroides ovatus]KAA3996021.1 class I SAM-dependent DNA methyltransferase [Bacteroides ovatus]KAA3996198.1 class I SAM-dependent DNA methyltransferase [Bacteroides ovatus]MCM1786205.1 class I SAM-dependent DNA methyltransferase [Bacteroides ovatus]MCM1809879.1 class I SAM-dependent DNA methyltransferase [Bacteroides ovatus]MDC2437743.1 TaqI-like C-terminal specificity domain-containing protein [Bacteroides ovatus]
MSDFIQQWHIECAFRSSDSWVILSPIEQSIKRKIEAVGTPLKNWNININYGIKTGYNDAFIINTEKREEILRNCRTEDERQRTAELIRPILRGRDIKRYGYNWDNLWLINTHNGIKGVKPRININEYSAVKAYLDQHWDKISKRADKGDTPYNLRNCAYMEDFYKPKIVWKIIGNQMAFAYDKNQFIMNNACYIMTGEHLDYLLSILNSQAILWYSYVTNMNKTGVGDVQVGGQNIITFPIPAYSDNKNILAKMADCVTNQKISLKSVDYQIENIISEIFGFTTDERNFLNTFANSLRKKG